MEGILYGSLSKRAGAPHLRTASGALAPSPAAASFPPPAASFPPAAASPSPSSKNAFQAYRY
eukprot:2062030-Rhodomonas_salina.2